MKIILITLILFIIAGFFLLFIEGKILLSKFGPVDTNQLRRYSLQETLLPNELVYSLKYNGCLLQNRHWSAKEGICVISFSDGGKVCLSGKDCISGKCLLDNAIFRQWTDVVYKNNGGQNPNKSMSPGDKIVYPQLPDTLQGKCSLTNLCDYKEAEIGIDSGVRHAIGNPCGQI